MFRHVTTRISGLIILIAGVWGGLIPFVGPYFHFVLGPDQHWKWTTGRLWLNVLPGAVAALGGLILMGGGPRVSGRMGALMALAAGVWFAVGPDVSMLWNHGVSQAGTPNGSHSFKRMLELVTFHSGLGVLITAFAAYALPGVTVVEREVAAAGAGATAGGAGRRGGAVRDAELVGGGAAVGAAAEHHHDRHVAEREAGGAAGAGAGATGAGAGGAGAAPAGEPAVEPVNREPVAEDGTATAAQQPAGQSGTRRRGGLAGLFSRR